MDATREVQDSLTLARRAVEERVPEVVSEFDRARMVSLFMEGYSAGLKAGIAISTEMMERNEIIFAENRVEAGGFEVKR